MTCYCPLDAYVAGNLTASGKMKLVFTKPSYDAVPLQIPCGQCLGCRLDNSRQWAIRIMHESELHDDNMFLTLTYDDEHLPQYESLVRTHFQLFMKRYRAKYPNVKISYFQCGEYGDETQRPHHHAIIFNHAFSDKKLFSMSNDIPLYTSDILNDLWKKGHCTIGDVTFDSAAYVSRYVTKKIKTSEKSDDRFWNAYISTCPLTGDVRMREPEYATMSLKPAIGKRWYEKFKSDIFPHDEVIINGISIQPPRYYDHLYSFEDAMKSFEMKVERRKNINQEAFTPERLKAKEKIQVAKQKLKSTKL